MWNKLTEKVPPFDTLVLCRGEHDVIDFEGNNYGKCPHYFLAFNQCYRPHCCMVRIIEHLPKELQTGKDTIEFFDCPDFSEWMEIPT